MASESSFYRILRLMLINYIIEGAQRQQTRPNHMLYRRWTKSSVDQVGHHIFSSQCEGSILLSVTFYGHILA